MSLFSNLPRLALAGLVCAGALHAEDDDSFFSRHRRHSRHDSSFAWQAQVDLPLKDLGRTLDHSSGLGLGAQWNHDHGNGHVSRTRLEWNVFREGAAVPQTGLKTQASNYILSFDRLYHLSGQTQGCYLLAGLGGVRWFLEQTPAGGPEQRFHTTKLAITGGAGYRFNGSVSLEGRYLVSTIGKTFDGNMLQLGVNLKF